MMPAQIWAESLASGRPHQQFSNGNATAPAELYLGYSHYSNPQHHSSILLMTDTLSPQVRAQFANYQNIWLINASPAILPTQILPDYAFIPAGPTKFPATLWQVVAKPKAVTRPSAR